MKKIMVIAGEASGDLHAGKVVCAMKRLSPEVEIFGVGGEKMKSCGVEIIYDISEISFIGFVDVVKNFKKLLEFKKLCSETLLKRKPDAVLLVDYPGFNLGFAKFAKENGFKVYYYIAPQVWAWGRARVKILRNYVDKLFLIFKFEEEFFKKYGVKAQFVGHPLLEDLRKVEDIKESYFFDNYQIEKKKVISFFPGSREHEIKMMLDVMAKAGEMLKSKFDVEVIFSKSKALKDFEVRKLVDNGFKLVDDSHLLLRFSHIAVVKSGTTSLEAGILAIPMVVCYKTSFLNYLIGRMLIKKDVIESISLPNILLSKKVVPELIQFDFSAEKIFDEVRRYLEDGERYNSVKSELLKLKDLLTLKGEEKTASELVAEKILSEL
jgi:lipid-A-disaccharide synthase